MIQFLYRTAVKATFNVKDNIKDIVNKRNERCNKSSYKPTKEDLSKLRKEDLINMIINEEEPKKNQD